MRHRRLHKIFAAACGLWLVLSLAEPAALHACAMHGDHAQTHSHAHHSTHGRSDGTGSRHGSDTGSSCTCLGGCCVAVHVATPDALPLVAVVATAHALRMSAPSALGHRPTEIEYARPPTIGPPTHTA